MSEKMKSFLFYVIAIPLAIIVVFLLYFNNLLYLLIPLVVIVVIVAGVVIWRREDKKAKARIEQMQAAGLIRSPTKKPAVIDYASLPKITAIISLGNKALVKAVEECTRDHGAYFNNHRDEYKERGIDSLDDMEKEEMCWLCMVDQLIDNGYAVEVDWKAAVEDELLYNLNTVVEKLRLAIDINSLGISDERIAEICLENESATWVGICETAAALKEKGYALGCIDTESDSYVLFLTEENQSTKDTLTALANQYGRSIHVDLQRTNPI